MRTPPPRSLMISRKFSSLRLLKMSAAILTQWWNNWRARYERPQDLELPTRHISEPGDVQPHPDTAQPNALFAQTRDLEVTPTKNEKSLKFMGTIKNSRLFVRQRWRKSLRFIRLVAWPLAFLKPTFYLRYKYGIHMASYNSTEKLSVSQKQLHT
jgi:hypothetical protein